MPAPKDAVASKNTQPKALLKKGLQRPALRAIAATIDLLRKNHDVDSLIPKLLSQMESEDGDVHYVINRLLRGVSSSVGYSRRNFSLALIALVRADSSRIATVIDAFCEVYTKDSNFDYKSGQRDRALGIVFVASALAKFIQKPEHAVRVLQLLRPLPEKPWQLGEPIYEIVDTLIRKSKKKSSLTKILWKWFEERFKYVDGLCVALVAWKNSLIPIDSIQKKCNWTTIGKCLDQVFAGFPVLYIPKVWNLTLEYASMKKELVQFWGVVSDIGRTGKSPEKKLLILKILLLVVAHMDEQSFEEVFTGDTAGFISALLLRQKNNNDMIKKQRISANAEEEIKNVTNRLGMKFVNGFFKRDQSECAVLFILWCVRHRQLDALFQGDELKTVLNKLGNDGVSKLFQSCIEEFVNPNKAAYGDAFDREVNSMLRTSILNFCFVLAAQFQGLLKDCMTFFTLYSVFSSVDNLAKYVKFENIKSNEKVNFKTQLPELTPKLTLGTTGAMFRRVIVFAADRRDGEEDVCVSSLVLSTILKVAESGAYKSVMNDCERVVNIITGVAKPLLEKLEEEPEDEKDVTVCTSLRILGEFLALMLFEPDTNDSDSLSGSSKIEECSSLFDSLSDCVEFVYDAKKDSKRKDDDDDNDDEEIASALERTTHLISNLCGYKSVNYSKIAGKALDALGDRFDDSVTAVLFDAMEAYLHQSISGNAVEGDDDDDVQEITEEELGKENNDSDDDEEEEEDSEDEKDANDEMEEQGDRMNVDSSGNASANTGNESNKKPMEDDDSDSENSIDIDIDKEDPERLAEFDRRLAAHLKLVQSEKKSASRKKQEAAFTTIKVTRVMGLLQRVGTRLRLDTHRKDVDQRTPIVLLDTMARLVEFCVELPERMQFLKAAMGMVTKHMSVPVSTLMARIEDSESVVEIGERLLQALVNCVVARKLTEEEARGVCATVGMVIGCGSGLGVGKLEHFLPMYDQLMRKMLQRSGHIACPTVFVSFIYKGPDVASRLVGTVQEMWKKEASKAPLASGSEVVLEIARALNGMKEGGEKDAKRFWKCFVELCGTYVNAEMGRKWKREGVVKMVETAGIGRKNRSLVWTKELERGFEEIIGTHKSLQKVDRVRLRKIVGCGSGEHDEKRRLRSDERMNPKNEEDGGEDENAKKKRRRKR